MGEASLGRKAMVQCVRGSAFASGSPADSETIPAHTVKHRSCLVDREEVLSTLRGDKDN